MSTKPIEPNPHVPDETYVKLSIASWIRDYLKAEGHSQVRLAKSCGLSAATISNYVSGTHLPGFKALVGLEFGEGAPLNEVMRHPHDALAGAYRPQAKSRNE